MSTQSRPQEKDSDDVKQRILDAAIKLFAEKGYAATSISDISSTAKVNRALIYYYFKDKYDLYYSILKSGNDVDIQIAEEVYHSNLPAIKKIEKFITRFSQMRAENERSIGRIIMRGMVDGPDMEGCMKEGFSRVAQILKAILREGAESGELRDMDPEKTIHVILGMTHSLVMMRIKNPEFSDPEENTRHIMNILTHGILNPTHLDSASPDKTIPS